MDADTGQHNNAPLPHEPTELAELSEIWQQLLNIYPMESERNSESEAELPAPPSLPADPWSALLSAQGVEIVDLQRLRSHMTGDAALNDPEVERALQIMQEQLSDEIL